MILQNTSFFTLFFLYQSIRINQNETEKAKMRRLPCLTCTNTHIQINLLFGKSLPDQTGCFHSEEKSLSAYLDFKLNTFI